MKSQKKELREHLHPYKTKFIKQDKTQDNLDDLRRGPRSFLTHPHPTAL